MAHDIRIDPPRAGGPVPVRPAQFSSLDVATNYSALRSHDYKPGKRRWPRVLGALLLAAALGVTVFFSYDGHPGAVGQPANPTGQAGEAPHT
jgi:hypothetical protein